MNKLEKFYYFMRPFFDGYRLSSDVRDFIICQFALESDFGTSRISLDSRNYCGMRYPLVRLSMALDKDPQSGFAVYGTLQDCVHDYFLCLQYHRPFSHVWDDVEKFKSFIAPWYCPERDYLDKITKIFNQLKSQNHV